MITDIGRASVLKDVRSDHGNAPGAERGMHALTDLQVVHVRRGA